VSCVKWIEAPTPIEIRFGALRCILTSKFILDLKSGTALHIEAERVVGYNLKKWYGVGCVCRGSGIM